MHFRNSILDRKKIFLPVFIFKVIFLGKKESFKYILTGLMH